MTHGITLLRHGLSVANESGVVQGQLDYPLAKVGIAQATSLAAYWRAHQERFDAILSSPLLRARQTAEIIAAELSLSVELDQGWMERHMGDGQGLAGDEFDQLRGTGPRLSPYEPMFGAGESYWDLHRRAGDSLQALVRRAPGKYLVVSHGALLNAVVRTLLGIAPYGRTSPPGFEFGNTGFARARYTADTSSWRIELLNATPHLEGTWKA
ncbi:MAG TPA: histidine phosphatase family protein [Anaerolineales bacterium]|nr:histidine phosphatase family protein [Anaerolineales bacterium]